MYIFGIYYCNLFLKLICLAQLQGSDYFSYVVRKYYVNVFITRNESKALLAPLLWLCEIVQAVVVCVEIDL